jgi:large subunit ribosomal protein L13e
MHHIKAIITNRNGKQKPGKGFSPNELKQAGVTKQKARRIGLPVDLRRKSTHSENIKAITAHSEQAKTDAKAKAKSSAEKPKKKAKS